MGKDFEQKYTPFTVETICAHDIWDGNKSLHKCPHSQETVEWTPVNVILITAIHHCNGTHAELFTKQCYAPTNDLDEEMKDAFYLGWDWLGESSTIIP